MGIGKYAIRGLLGLLSSSVVVFAFPPTTQESLGNLIGTSHYSLTQWAVVSMDSEFFNLDTLTVSMKKARDEIAEANAKVDVTDEHLAESHVDGESFENAQDRLAALRSQVKYNLRVGDGPSARQYLGQALHTVQDFYSHSNWVELGNTDVNMDMLGLSTSKTIPQPDPSSRTCVNCKYSIPGQNFITSCQDACKPGNKNPINAALTVICLEACTTGDCSSNLATSDLTSGYYSGEAFDVKPGNWKCSHGGPYDDSAEGIEGINKDTKLEVLSPHAALHQQAADLAFLATLQFIREFKKDPDITTRDLKLLLGVGPCLAFAIDTTGSMDDIIDPVRQEAIQIVKSKIGTEDEPSLYVLSQIQDPIPDGGYVTVATDADTFIAQISALESGGGGDCPEASTLLSSPH